MPEEKDDKGAGPKPTVNVEEFRGVIESTMRDVLAQQGAGRGDEFPDESRGARPVAWGREVAPANPLADLVGGIVDPALKATGMAAASAHDAAIFYAAHPDAIKHQKDIERGVAEMAKAGVYLTREAVYNHWRGQNIDKIIEERDKERENAAKRAEEAAGVPAGAPGSVGRVKAPAGDPVSWSDEDLDKFLKSSGASGAAVAF